MKRKLATLIGLRLPFYIISIPSLLILMSFISRNSRFLIIVDTLILVAILLMPVVFALGIIVSIIAVVQFEKKRTFLIGVVSNIALLVALLCFIKPFLVEFQFLI